MIGRNHWLVLGILLLAALGLAAFLRKGTSELEVYVRAADRMWEGLDIYRPGEEKPFTYPPFFAIPFLPFVLLPEWIHRTLWYLLNLGMLVWILKLLSGLLALDPLRRSEGRSRVRFWVLVLLLSGRHLSSVIENQSHDLVVLLLILLALDAGKRRREAVTGAHLGLAAACKATPLLFAPLFALQKRFLAAGILCLAALAATFLPDLLLPRLQGGSWTISWYESFLGRIEPGQAAEAEGAWSAWNKLNQSLPGTLHRLSTPIPVPGEHAFDVSLWHPSPGLLKGTTLAAQMLLLLVLGFSFLEGRKRGPPERLFRRLGEGGLVVTAMVLLSPMSSKSHFCVLLLPVAFCLADLLHRKRDPLLMVLLGLAFVSGTLTMKGLVGARLGNQLLARGSVTLSALALFLASAHVLRQRARNERWDPM